MSAIVFAIEQLAIGLYILIAVGMLISLRGILRWRSAYRGTNYELERDIFSYRRANSLTILILLIEAALIVYGVGHIVAPKVREINVNTQPVEVVISDGDFRTPTPQVFSDARIDASGVQLEELDPAEQVQITPTLTPTPVGTIIPNMPPPVGCETEDAWLQVPPNGMVVFEPITVRGVARTDDFAFYRFEIKGPSTFENFAPREDYPLPVTELGELGAFVPAFYEPGEYQFRLAVFDVTNALKASCTVNILISDPIPTPTPLGQGLDANARIAPTPSAG
jgi:hypothetical protein